MARKSGVVLLDTGRYIFNEIHGGFYNWMVI